MTLSNRLSSLTHILLPAAFLLGIGLGYLFWGRQVITMQAQVTSLQADLAAVQEQATGESSAQQTVKRYDVPVDDDPSLGPANAAITLIEFSDYECPYCQKWHQEVFGRLREAYPDQVRFVYRDFPLESLHPNAIPASEAANCANEQGAFWEYHDMLFSGEYGLGTEAFKKYANDLGLDMTKFEQCLSERKYAAEVQADFEYAANLGVRSTPTFFLNGIALVGAQPFELFQEVIEKELAGEIPK